MSDYAIPNREVLELASLIPGLKFALHCEDGLCLGTFKLEIKTLVEYKVIKIQVKNIFSSDDLYYDLTEEYLKTELEKWRKIYASCRD